ncbi:MAG: oligosaccharide flippase family protein, partial [Verrucomicrobiota bacterium]
MATTETRKRALAGSAWTLFGYGGAQVIRLGSNLILAHMLYPAAFGVMALVTVFMQGLQMFSEVGIGPSIIQNRRGDDPAFLDTAWTIQVLRGIGLWIFTCLLAWPTAAFFGQNDPLAKDLLYILPVIGLSSILGGFNSTAVFSLNRHLQVGKATLLELVPQLISVIAMIVWAWLAPSVWALVGGWLFYSIVRLPM